MPTFRRSILLMVIFFGFSSRGQNIIPRFETINVNDGLSQSSVYSIYQDKKGFMWFGTADGLNRYDGKSIKVYNINTPNVAYSNYIRGNICEDNQGGIWFTNETGIFCYDPISDKLTRKLTFAQYIWTEGLYTDKNNVLYLFYPSKGVFAYHINTGKLVLTKCRFNMDGDLFTSVFICTDKQSTIWIKDPKKNELCIFNTATQTMRYVKTAPGVYTLFYAGNGKLCHDMLNGTILVTDTAFRLKETLKYPLPKGKVLVIQTIVSDAYHRLWISTIDNGLICYDEGTKRFTNYIHDNSRQKSLPINILSNVYIDRADNMWIGSDGGGVSKLDVKAPRFNLFPLNEGDHPFLKDYFTKCFYEDGQGKIWFGTHSNGLNIFDPHTGKLTNYNYRPDNKNSLPGPIVSSIFRDRDGTMWVAYSTGLAIFNPKNNTFHPIKLWGAPTLNEHNNFIFKIIQLQNGEMVAATYCGLVTITKINGTYTAVFNTQKLKNDLPMTDVVEMRDSTLWATSPVNGLLHYRKTGTSFSIIEKKFTSIDLRSIHRDESDKNLLWIGSGIGLIRFNTGTGSYYIYNESNGMPNNYVYGILEDDQHNLWMSTNKGICFLNRKTYNIQSYTAKDGLQSNEFNTQAFYKGASGTLYFGGIKGFNWFKPHDVKTPREKLPGVAITTIDVDDKAYVKDASFTKNPAIVLAHDHNNLSFSFAALDYTKPEANRIQFILQGWDKNWTTSVNGNIRYAHLTPGQYTLRVKAANSDGNWSAEERLSVLILTPFWQTTWFYTLMIALALAVIIYSTYLLSQQKIKKQLRLLEKEQAINVERNRISRDMHDEIGSGLTHIALLSELIGTQDKTVPAIQHDVSNIAIAARQLVESMSEIIWAFNPQNDAAENLLAYTREQMQYHFAPLGVKLVIDFPDDVPGVKLTNEQRRNLYLVTKEGLNNVLKHSNATVVILSVTITGTTLYFTITDNGVGLPLVPSKSQGNGLKNMHNRMDDIGGKIEWLSTPDGLSVKYSLKGMSA